MLERGDFLKRGIFNPGRLSAVAAWRTKRFVSRGVQVSRSTRYLSIFCISAIPGICNANTLDLNSFTKLAQRCGSTVTASTLAAVAKTESGFETLATLDNTTGRSHTYETLEEAVSTVERLVASGHSVDIGLMQINSANLRRLGMNVRDALDACKSISGGAEILTDNFLRTKNASTEQIALRDAISEYNTGNSKDGYRNGYVRKVEQAAKTLLSGLVAKASISSAPAGIPGMPGGDNPAPQSWDVWHTEEPSPAAAAPAAVTISNNVNVF